MRFLLSFLILFAPPLWAADIIDMAPRNGWAVHASTKTYAQLVKDTRKAVQTNGMAVVTQAGPTGAAKNRGITIPGNLVIGVFNNVFAVKMLNISTAAMIEAPIRIYITENTDGSATLSYKLPSHIFAPYAGTAQLAAELDTIFAKIAASAHK